ncbi:WD repeat-containing protein 55 homolog [Cephus cinctus]|uniref:WD repeat-containing protein 55 homolog n=1 Tax=Cephus cinctus TaxID=211228 RepID=A0AAJ7C1U3_CEPCN|nr:WD repeat-containing protein 55 homolog [Cephus cinctus]
MRSNTGDLKDYFLSDSDSDHSDISMSDDSQSSEDVNVSDPDSESLNESHDDIEASTSNGVVGGSRVDNEEEDEVVKAILRSKELHRDHPPTISMEDPVVDVCFHPAKDLIALASMTGDVLLYKYNNKETELVSTLELHLKSCRDIKFSHDGKLLFSTARDKLIMLTDVETEKLLSVYQNSHEDSVYSMTILDENTFVTGDDSGVVKLWDLRQSGDTPVFSLKEVDDYISDMITNSDNKYLVCSCGDGTLTTINMPARKMHVQSEEYGADLTCLGLFKTESKLLTASIKGKMYVFNWGEFGLHSDEFPALTKKAINCMIPITENVVITGSEDGLIRASSLFPHRQLGIVGQHNFTVENIDVNHDGTLIASSSHNKDVHFWNVQYFETLNVHEPVKGGKQKRMKHNLPSSKVDNASDFFADL